MTLPPDPPDGKEEEQAEPVAEESSVDNKLERIIEAVPEPKRAEFREIIREFMGIIHHSKSASPFDINPEVAQIMIDAQVKDNQNKFEFAKQRQKDNHELRMTEHRDRYSVVRPLIFIVTAISAAILFLGIWLSYVGHNNLGGCLITGVITGVLGYLAGAGTSEWFKASSK
jgi:hypothetical protein